jgi:hypothetical protein
MRRTLLRLLPVLATAAPSLFAVGITLLAIANNPTVAAVLARVRIPSAG